MAPPCEQRFAQSDWLSPSDLNRCALLRYLLPKQSRDIESLTLEDVTNEFYAIRMFEGLPKLIRYFHILNISKVNHLKESFLEMNISKVDLIYLLQKMTDTQNSSEYTTLSTTVILSLCLYSESPVITLSLLSMKISYWNKGGGSC